MGMWADEAFRLVRTIWQEPNSLAEELFTIFRSARDVVFDSPLVLQGDGVRAPLQIETPAGSDPDVPAVVITHGDDPPVTITTGDLTTLVGAGAGGSGGSTVVAGGGGTPCKVLSGGPGATYSVRLYPDNVAGATVTATQLQIHASETIPAGTWAIATLSGTHYYIQVSVWL